MLIYVGADHRGFQLKETVKRVLADAGYPVVDLGSAAYDEGDDYPHNARRGAEKVSGDFEQARGVLICGSGAGVAITANKFVNVRAAVAMTPDHAFDLKNDDDVNVLCLAASYIEPDVAKKIVITWLQTPPGGDERFHRRIERISMIEEELRQEVREEALADIRQRRELGLGDEEVKDVL